MNRAHLSIYIISFNITKKRYGFATTLFALIIAVYTD